jgi:hypothetical protein
MMNKAFKLLESAGWRDGATQSRSLGMAENAKTRSEIRNKDVTWIFNICPGRLSKLAFIQMRRRWSQKHSSTCSATSSPFKAA